MQILDYKIKKLRSIQNRFNLQGVKLPVLNRILERRQSRMPNVEDIPIQYPKDLSFRQSDDRVVRVRPYSSTISSSTGDQSAGYLRTSQ